MRTSLRASRRNFVATAAALAGIGALRAPAKAAEFELRCATNQTYDHPSTVRLTQMFKAILDESHGRVHTQLFPNSQLGGDTAMLNQVRVGALDFQLCGIGTLPSAVPSANIGFIGFAYKDAVQGLHAIDGPLGDYIRDEATTKNLHCLHSVWDTGMLQISSSNHPIKVPDDLKSFKIRVAESRIAVDLFKTFGATPTPVSTGEVYTSLQSHLIDGASAPINTMDGGHYYEVQKYISLTNHQCGSLWMITNTDLWKRLGPELQGIIERNNTKYATMERRDSNLLSASVIDKLTRRGVAISRVDQTPFRNLLGDYYKFWAKEFGAREWGLLEAAVGTKLG